MATVITLLLAAVIGFGFGYTIAPWDIGRITRAEVKRQMEENSND